MTKEEKKEYDKIYSAKPEVKAKRNKVSSEWYYNDIERTKQTHKEYRTKNAEKMKLDRKNNVKRQKEHDLMRNYNMSIEQYYKMVDVQNGCCEICKRPRSEFKRAFDVDHDHELNENRGLLCTNCNRALGMFQDSIEILNSAIAYKNKYDTGHLILRRITERRLKIQELIKSSLEKIN